MDNLKAQSNDINKSLYKPNKLWMPEGEIDFTARPKIKPQSQILRYGQSPIFPISLIYAFIGSPLSVDSAIAFKPLY